MPATEKALVKFSDQILTCMSKLDRLLVPPFEEAPSKEFEEFVIAIRDATKAEAVSIFMVSEDDPNVLIYRAGKGYKEEYRNSQYFVDGSFLTSYVCREQTSINASQEQLKGGLKVGKEKVPFAGRCESFIESGKFFNIAAVPILFEKKSLGVLKLENKGKDSKKIFPEEDFALARTLASIIGVAYQQRTYAKLWNEGERISVQSRSLETYVREVTKILTKRLNAECASVFIKDQSPEDDPILKYAGGTGYKEEYKTHIYQLSEAASAFTTFIFEAKTETCRRLTAADIRQLGLPYSGACSSKINSGTFRNILAFALRSEESKSLGVLKIENKFPEHSMFDSHDEEVTKAFVEKQIVPTITRLISKQGSTPRSTKGYNLLVKELGQPIRTNRDELMTRIRAVYELKNKSNVKITTGDCTNYLQISKPHYFRLIKKIAPATDSSV